MTTVRTREAPHRVACRAMIVWLVDAVGPARNTRGITDEQARARHMRPGGVARRTAAIAASGAELLHGRSRAGSVMSRGQQPAPVPL